MQLHELRPAPGSRRQRTRVGRGIAAGQGKTSGRGQKGQFSRSSVSLPRAFEGGQMPLSQRLPKLRGFHNRFRRDVAVVNVGKLNRFAAGTVVDEAALREAGLAARTRNGVKLLNAGRLRVGLTVRVHYASASARAAVEAAGGSVELLAAKPAVSAPELEAAATAGEVAAEPVAAADEAPPRRRKPRAAAAEEDEGEADAAEASEADAAEASDDGSAE